MEMQKLEEFYWERFGEMDLAITVSSIIRDRDYKIWKSWMQSLF